MAEAPQPAPKLKVLVVSDVCGKFDQSYKFADTVATQHGAFTMMLCVGKFFGGSNKEIEPYASGSKKASIPTFFITTSEEESIVNELATPTGAIAENIFYLGKSGVKEVHGLQVAFFSGTRSKTDKRGMDYDETTVLDLTKRGAQLGYKGVDVLLTNNWPKGILNDLGGPGPVGVSMLEYDLVGMDVIGRIATALAPRYHFSASPKHTAFERAPYTNLLQPCHVTRFIALADSFNEKKHKFRYAFNIAPLKLADQAELLTVPPNTTPFPFTAVRTRPPRLTDGLKPQTKITRVSFISQANDAQNAKKRSFHEVEQQQVKQLENPSYPRFAQAPAPPHSKKPKVEQHPLLKRTAGCWFCLSNPEVEKHLVLSVGDESYLALAKGGLNSQHCLIIPIAHAKSFVSLDGSVKDEMNKYKQALRDYFKSQGKGLVLVEQNLPTKTTLHMHIQAVPIDEDKIPKAQSVFEEVATELDMEVGQLDKDETLEQVVGDGHYIFVELDGGVRLVHRVDPDARRLPLQFGRRVLAKLMGAPEREDWKNCSQPKHIESETARSFKESFKQFDFTL